MRKAGNLKKYGKWIMDKQNRVIQSGIKLLLPNRCPVCDKPVKFSEGLICRTCYRKLDIIKEPACFRCGKPLAKEEQEYCRDCGKQKHLFISGRSLYAYEDVQASIYRFKYGGRQEYAKFFGKEMAVRLYDFISQVRADALVPVPISKSRLKKRGYNQADLLAVQIGKQLNIPVLTHLTERTKNTLPQKGLNATERQKNVKGAFKIVQNDVKLSTIILVDDIYTTGSTMDALAYAFHSSGIKKIYFIALAITTGA